MPKVTYEQYKALREKHGFNAYQAKMHAQQDANQPRWFKHAVEQTVKVPGTDCTLVLEVPSDDDNDFFDGDGQELKWTRIDYEFEQIRAQHVGAHMGYGWLSTGYTHRGQLAMVKMTSGGDRASRIEWYRKDGMSKQVAFETAQAAVKKEMEYWYRVVSGGVYKVGVVVKLLDENDTQIAEEALWGIESESDEYILQIANDFAAELVRAHYKELAEKQHWAERDVVTV